MEDLPAGTVTPHHTREKELSHKNKLMADLPAGAATSTSRKTIGFMMLLLMMVMMLRCNQDAIAPEPWTLYTVDIKEIKHTYANMFVMCKIGLKFY